MDLGVMIFPTATAIRPDHLARELEDRGFESLWVPEHTHIPTSRLSPFPGGRELPNQYRGVMDPFLALTAAAAVTSRLRLGTAVCLVAQHDPIVLAKQVTTLDLLSDGRFSFGVGFGWNREEAENHGVDFSRRRSICREKVLAMLALWANEVAGFDGEFVQITESWQWPKPVQQPRPPILFGGGASEGLFRHIVEHGDGWIPIGGTGGRQNWAMLQRMAEEHGRDPGSIELVVLSVPPDPGKLEYFREIGVRRAAFGLPAKHADRILPILDGYAELVEKFNR